MVKENEKKLFGIYCNRILDSINRLRKYTKNTKNLSDFSSSEVVQDACLMQLQHI